MLKPVPSGYYTQDGYVGFLPDGRYMIFPTDKEYQEYLLEGLE